MATILVVDDEGAIVEVLQEILQEEGHRVLTAHNGREALRLAREDVPDLVLSDVMMPLMGGDQLAAEWRADPALAATPIIFMSALEPTMAVQRLAAAFIGKPFDLDRLIALIATCLANAGGPSPVRSG